MSSAFESLVERYKAEAEQPLTPPPLPHRRSTRGPVIVTTALLVVAVAAGAIALSVGWGGHGGQRLRVIGSPTPSFFPASIYPPAARFPDWGSPGGCPSLSGVIQPVQGTATAAALAAINSRGATQASNRAVSDRAYWPIVDESFGGSSAPNSEFRTLTPADVTGTPASAAPDADLIRNQCGAATLAVSWAVSDLPSASPALSTTFYLIDRNGVWLIWMTNP
jgi:hypothetical protein